MLMRIFKRHSKIKFLLKFDGELPIKNGQCSIFSDDDGY